MLDQDRKDEAWALILPYLRKPIPIPLTAPPRSALRQPHLCAAIATCKLFQEICEPILYENVVTDSFHHMFRQFKPASLRRRFGHTVRLFIEYEPKGEEPSYRLLMINRTGLYWSLTGQRQAEKTEREVDEYSEELGAILATLSFLNQMGVRSVFERIESIAISSIYGRNTEAYINYELRVERQIKAGKRTKEAKQAYDNATAASLLHTSAGKQWKLFFCAANPLHFCSRDTNGIYDGDRMDWASEGCVPKGDCTLTYHFNSVIHKLPVIFGRSVVWACDAPLLSDWSTPIYELGRMLVDHFDIRRDYYRSRGTPGEKCDIDLYCSTAVAKPLPDPNSLELRLHPSCVTPRFNQGGIGLEIQDSLCEWLQRSTDGMLEQYGWTNETMTWRSSPRTPICEACGSGAPGAVPGDWITGYFDRREAENTEGIIRTGDWTPIPANPNPVMWESATHQAIRIS